MIDMNISSELYIPYALVSLTLCTGSDRKTILENDLNKNSQNN